MNRQEIIGHIGNDAEVKDLTSNQVINFSVAVSKSYTKKDTGEKVTQTTWFECAKWGNNTQIAQYLKKGQQVYISGQPNNRAWQNENGEIKVVNGILVNEIQLFGSAKENIANSAPNQTSKESIVHNAIPMQNQEEHDDLPF